MIKICPKCRAAFECKEEDVINCDCMNIKLSPETRKKISALYNDCLCIDCLIKLEKQTTNSGKT